jgi:hypothetical protein
VHVGCTFDLGNDETVDLLAGSFNYGDHVVVTPLSVASIAADAPDQRGLAECIYDRCARSRLGGGRDGVLKGEKDLVGGRFFCLGKESRLVRGHRQT